MNPGIIICTRLDSRRLPGKALMKIGGKPVLQHLIDRLGNHLPICLAVPETEYYEEITSVDYQYYGYDDDPLQRMYRAAKTFKLDPIIRITHDKIFVSKYDIQRGLKAFLEAPRLDYLYSSTLTPGTGFEIISREALKRAAIKFKDVEHISYAIKAVTNNKYNMPFFDDDLTTRLLIDYPEDVEFLKLIMNELGPDCSKDDISEFIRSNPHYYLINRQPDVTFYTCAYNAEDTIQKAMDSVANQANFRSSEYIIIDDHSSDQTFAKALYFAEGKSNVRVIRLPQNVGLASASNQALREARGKWIMRLDADDFFLLPGACCSMIDAAMMYDVDALYPAFYDQKTGKYMNGDSANHIGGALFKNSAMQHLKFTEKLRGYEGLDFFKRAKNQLSISYYPYPTFHYSYSPNSLSHTNLEEREEIKKGILGVVK